MTRGTAVAIAALLSACGGATAEPDEPVWERPGLEGAVRPEMGPPQPGDRAPDAELPRTGGGTFHLADARGSWVMLHFTATWCPFCDAEVEHLAALADDYRSRGLQVALIDVKEEPAAWAAYVAEHVRSEALLVLEDRDGAVAARYAPERAQPSFTDRSQVMLAATVLIDPDGVIRLFLLADSRHFDPTFAGVRTELDRLLGGATGSAGRAGSAAGGTGTLLAPEAVVVARVVPPAPMEAGGRGELRVELRIAAGYHVMSDRPSDPLYIATEVGFEPADGVDPGPARYPPPSVFRLQDREIRTFEGEAVVTVPLSVADGAAAGPRALSGTLRYQACTEGACLFPVDRPLTAEVVVAGTGTGSGTGTGTGTGTEWGTDLQSRR